MKSNIFVRILFVGSLFASLLISSALISSARAEAKLPVHCENDTAEIKRLLQSLSAYGNAGERVAAAALSFVGKSGDNRLATDSLMELYLNVDTFTPLGLVNASLAAAGASEVTGGGLRAYEEAFRSFSCRKGEYDGFPSVFFHTSDWIGDNIYRGNLTELTDSREGARSMTASLDYLSSHRDEIPALANDSVYDRVRMTEMGFRTHKIPYLPRQIIGKRETEEDLRDGDIIVMVSTKGRSDMYKIGVVRLEKDGPHLIYYDDKRESVVMDPEPLKRFFNINAKYFSGFRWLRLKQ